MTIASIAEITVSLDEDMDVPLPPFTNGWDGAPFDFTAGNRRLDFYVRPNYGHPVELLHLSTDPDIGGITLDDGPGAQLAGAGGLASLRLGRDAMRAAFAMAGTWQHFLVLTESGADVSDGAHWEVFRGAFLVFDGSSAPNTTLEWDFSNPDNVLVETI